MHSGKRKGNRIALGLIFFFLVSGIFSCATNPGKESISVKTETKIEEPVIVKEIVIEMKIGNIDEIVKYITSLSYIQLLEIEDDLLMTVDSRGIYEYISDFPKMIIPVDGKFEYRVSNIKINTKYAFVIQKLDPIYTLKPMILYAKDGKALLISFTQDDTKIENIVKILETKISK